jgi:hypothetical protein
MVGRLEIREGKCVWCCIGTPASKTSEEVLKTVKSLFDYVSYVHPYSDQQRALEHHITCYMRWSFESPKVL